MMKKMMMTLAAVLCCTMTMALFTACEKDDGYMVFYTNTPEEEIEVSTSMVVAWDSALEAAKEFFTRLVKPTCLEWEEL